MSDRLSQVLQAIDDVNRQDPNGRELPFSERLTAWVLKLNPNASEPLRIAARGQHIGRWTVPRNTYPMDKPGYLRWREDLKRFHAKTVVDIMAKAGYSEDDQAQTRTIILKKYQVDADAQTIEDALCLEFLENGLAAFRVKETEERMIDILRKSWKKMSEKGRAEALNIRFGPSELPLIEKALAGDGKQ